MSRLTPEERRRVFLAQQRAHEAMRSRMAQTSALAQAIDQRRNWRRVFNALALVALLGGALAAAQIIDFHAPASLVEVLMPRL